MHISIGLCLGYTVLHPVSVVIYELATSSTFILPRIFFSASNTQHFWMGIYFSLIGALFGLLNGLYTHRTAVLYEKVKRLSITDELTGLFNRRYFIESLSREVRRADRYARDLSLVIIDIDHFKKYNDTFGHAEGDLLLRRFADHIRSTARKTDVVTRYGGEEFTILMPDTSLVMASRLAERIRQNIQDHFCRKNDAKSAAGITVSMGCASLGRNTGCDFDSLIRNADACLYRAKAGGRNQICC